MIEEQFSLQVNLLIDYGEVSEEVYRKINIYDVSIKISNSYSQKFKIFREIFFSSSQWYYLTPCTIYIRICGKVVILINFGPNQHKIISEIQFGSSTNYSSSTIFLLEKFEPILIKLFAALFFSDNCTFRFSLEYVCIFLHVLLILRNIIVFTTFTFHKAEAYIFSFPNLQN